MIRVKAVRALKTCTVAFVAFAFLTVQVAAPGLTGGYALAQPAATTVPDSTYGEGGTKQSLSNGREAAEVWRDGNGIVRERHEQAAGGDEYWGFFFQDGSSTSEWGGSGIAVRPMERPAGRWEMTVFAPGGQVLKEYSVLSKDELDKEFTYWRGQMRSWVNGFLRPAQPQQQTLQQPPARNAPPLEPGPARIRPAQGLGDDDLGFGVILGGIVLGAGALVWLMFGQGDDDDSSGTGTN